MLKRDNLKLGIIIGLIAPFVGFAGYYLMRFRLFTLKEFWQVLMMQKSLLSGIISLALIVNVIVFTLYINKRLDKTATGIFIATCVYAVIALLLKWFV
jgi:tryptophan-rich sensory protein